MCGTRVFLGLAVVFVAVHARPDGYGVKGGRLYKPTANAVASAHATAYADAGGIGIAKSSASATASANASGGGGGGTSNADATANASIDEGNIGKVVTSEKANGNANGLGDSDDLRQSSDRDRDTEYKCINHEDGTVVSNHRNPNAEHVASVYEDTEKTGQAHDNPECAPENFKGHGDASGEIDKSRCKENKPRPNTFPTQHEGFDLTAHSQHSAEIGGGYGENSPKPGTVGGVHAASPCAFGDSKCIEHKPSVTNPYPTYEKNPDFSAGSSRPAGDDGGYGVNSQKPGNIGGGHAPSPCTPEDSKCHAHKPSVSNPHLTYEHTGLTAGSLSQPGIDGGYGENIQKPGTIGVSHASSLCTPGDSKCFAHNPSVSNPHPTYEKHTDSSAGSSSQAGIDGSYGENSKISGTIGGSHAASLCTPGDSKCFAHKPSVSNTLAGSSITTGIDSGYGGNSQKLGTIGASHPASPCTPGDLKCFAHKPIVSNLHPTYEENPHLSAGSPSPVAINGGYGGNSPNPGTTGGSGNHAESPCASDHSKCFSNEPTVTNPHATHDKHPNLSADSQHSIEIDSGYGGNKEKHGAIGGSYSASLCTSGDSKCFAQKPSVSNSYPTHDANPATWGSGSKYPTSFEAGYEGQHTKGDHRGSANAAGHSASSGNKPGTSNPFFNGQIHLSDIKNPSNSGLIPAGKPNPLNPFLNPHSQVNPPTGTNHPNNPSGINEASVDVTPQYPQGGSSGSSGFPQDRPKPPNPFFSHHVQADSTSGSKYPGVSSGHQQSNTFPNVASHPVTNGPLNSGCYGSIPCSPGKPSEHLLVPPEYPYGTSSSGSGHQDDKPNSSNPFLAQHGHGDKSTDTKYPGLDNHGNQHSHAGDPVNISPSTNCHGSATCSTNKPSEGPLENPFLTNHGPKIDGNGIYVSGHGSIQLPGKQPGNSNPFMVDGQLIKPDSKSDTHGPSNLKPDNGLSVANPLQGCGSGISSAGCNNHKALGDRDFQSSVTEGHEIDATTGRSNYGVKGHGPGVKGGSHHQGNPIRLEGSSGLGENGHFRYETKSSAESTANASASAHSNAHASSSSYSGAGQSSASAKSEAHSSDNGYGSSNSWSSSSASASAFASSDSSSYSHHGWVAPIIPQVPAQ